MLSYASVEAGSYTVVAIVIVVLLLVYRWSTATFGFFKQRNVKYTEPWPLVGNLAPMLTGQQTVLEIGVEFYERFKHEA